MISFLLNLMKTLHSKMFLKKRTRTSRRVHQLNFAVLTNHPKAQQAKTTIFFFFFQLMIQWVSNLGFSWPVILFPAGFTNTSKVSCQVGWELHSLEWSLLEQLVFAPYCHTYSSMTAQAFSHGNEGKLLRKQFGSMQDASRSRPRTQLHFRWVLFHWSKKVLGPTQT